MMQKITLTDKQTEEVNEIRLFLKKSKKLGAIAHKELIDNLGFSSATITSILTIEKNDIGEINARPIQSPTALTLLDKYPALKDIINPRLQKMIDVEEAKNKTSLPKASKSKPIEITDEEIDDIVKPLQDKQFTITKEGDGVLLIMHPNKVSGSSINLTINKQEQKVLVLNALTRMVKDLNTRKFA